MSNAQTKSRLADRPAAGSVELRQDGTSEGKLETGPVGHSPFWIRDLSSPYLTELWLVSAVVTILGVRLYLELTGYPQVGGATLHIAHMLWARWRW